jgi:protein-S-isoprenylcysteine O-methyltransferase Ste14
MEQSMFKVVYGIGFIMTFIIRLPYWWRARTRRIVVDRKTGREIVLLSFLSVGLGALPLVFIFTPWLGFADYRLPSWAGWTGAAIFALALWLLWRAHATLGPYWSDSLQLREGHQLITSGIYRHIRHPMYAFGWLLGIAQPLLLQNWIAGLSGLVSFALLYFSRVPREEQMMLDQFGEEYRAYMNRTGRVIPRLRSGSEDKERS